MKRNNQYMPDTRAGIVGLPKSVTRLLREESQQWLTACLDPYHDNQYDVEGLPDERTAPSVVQIHNQTYTLSAPTKAGSGNWDANIIYTGFNSLIDTNTSGGMVMTTSPHIHPYDHNAISPGIPFGSLLIQAVEAGAGFVCGAPKLTGQTYDCLGSNLNTDRCRVIGVAFEVHNTTAEIYRQGSMTVAMLPDAGEDAQTIRYADTNGTGTIPIIDYQADRGPVFASTLPPLQAVPGSQTWPAADGVYAIPRMTKIPREVMSFKTQTPSTGSSGTVSRCPIVFGTDGKIATPEPTGWITVGSQTVPICNPFRPSGFSPIQCYFSGLSNATTLTVTFRTIVEYFPALGSTLLPLASPSPCFDPDVLRLYSESISLAPYAVPVGENSAGDYFRRIAAILGKALVLTSPLFGEFGFAAAAGGKALQMASDRIGSKKVK